MVDLGINDPISDRLKRQEGRGTHYLGDDVLGVLLAVQLQLEADVAQRDLGVGEGDHADTGLDDVVAQAQDQVVVVILLELGAVLSQGRLELGQVSYAHSLCDVQVGHERKSQHGKAESGSVGEIAHEQLHDQSQLVDCLEESGSRRILGSLADCLEDVLMGGGVIQLQRVDAPQVVHVADKLVVAHGFREG